jgi:hypothetical protein
LVEARLRAPLPAGLLAGPRPHRAGLLQAQGLAAEGGAQDLRDASGFFRHCGSRAPAQLL